GRGQGGAAAGEGVEHQVILRGAGPDDPAEDLLGHLAAVPSGAFLEGPADAGDVPGVGGGLEAFGDVLGAEDPGVVGEPPFRVGSAVVVDQLTGRGDPDGLVVEGEPAGVLDEVEQVGVAAGELPGAV